MFDLHIVLLAGCFLAQSRNKCKITRLHFINDIVKGTPIVLDLSPEAWSRVARSRAVVDKIVAENRVVYGITTGFGNFANVVIPHDKVEEVRACNACVQRVRGSE